MDVLIKKKIAEGLINLVNQLNLEINSLKLKISQKKSQYREINEMTESITSKFKKLVEISQTHFVLPEKLIDNTLILFNNFLDTLYLNGESDFNIVADNILTYYSLFIQVEQNYKQFNLDFSGFINFKWKQIEKAFNFFVCLIDKYQVKNFDLQTHLNRILEFIHTIYFKIDNDIRYRIIPGLISKLLKVISLDIIKITAKTIIDIDLIFRDSILVIFLKISQLAECQSNITKLKSNFFSFCDFYHLYYIRLKERLDEITITKIIEELIITHGIFIKSCIDHKINLKKFLFEMDQIKYTEFLQEIEDVFYFLYNKVLDYSSSLNLEKINFYIDLLEIDRDCFKEKLSSSLSKLSSNRNKEEFDKFNASLSCNLLNLTIFMKIILKDESIKQKILEGNYLDIIEISDNHINFTEITKLIEDFTEVFIEKSFKLKENIIFSLVNNYEIQVKNINRKIALEKFQNCLIDSLQYSKEINFQLIFRFLQSLIENFEEFYLIVIKKIIFRLSSSCKKIKKIFSYEDIEINIPVKEFKKYIDEALNCYLIITVLLISFLNKNKSNFNQSLHLKHMKCLKVTNLYLQRFLYDFQEILDFIPSNKISLFNSFLIFCNSFLIKNFKQIFNKNEKNTILMTTFNNYCSKIEILKYSSIIFLAEFTNSADEGILMLKVFVQENFDFIISTVINRIMYFEHNNKKSISNTKLETLNFFNSLILLLHNINDEKLNNFYYGELNKFLKKLLIHFDYFMKEKNLFNLECFAEIIEKITEFQEKVFKYHLNLFDSTKDNLKKKDNDLVMYLKNEIGISESNLYRNLILRFLTLLLTNRISIIYKVLKTFINLIPILQVLPMTREEKVNFSTEDSPNVTIRNSLGPIMHESWDYFLYIIKMRIPHNSWILKITNLILDLLIKVAETYSNFFNDSRIFKEFIPEFELSIEYFSNSYDSSQLTIIVTKYIQLLSIVLSREKCHLGKENLLVLNDLYLNKSKYNIDQIYNIKMQEILNKLNKN
jgi:hypothetical protein